MRILFGIVLGIVLTIGAAFFHDNNVAAAPGGPPDAARQIVNWDVLGAVLRDSGNSVRRLWDHSAN